MRFTAQTLDALKHELSAAFSRLPDPLSPTRLFACTTAEMPPAADWASCSLHNTTLNVIMYSDGVSWYRADTGAAI